MIRGIGFAIAGVALTCGLWWAFKPAHNELGVSTPSLVAEARATLPLPDPRSAGERIFKLELKEGRLVSGPSRLEAREGDRVVLEVVSDARDELHVHGYDLKQRLMPGETAKLSFMAEHTGRFGLELHRAHAELGALEVYPR